jgi:hypothetical protein
MNDSAIIRTISKIHFIISSLALFIFLVASLLYVSLINGLEIDSLHLPGVKVEKLYIIWDEKLSLDIKELTIKRPQTERSGGFDPVFIRKVLLTAELCGSWFRSITLNNIRLNDTTATFRYKDTERGYFIASSEHFIFESDLHLSGQQLSAQIKRFHEFKSKSRAEGTILLDLKQDRLYSRIDTEIAESLPLRIYAQADKTQLAFNAHGTRPFDTVKPVVQLFNLGPLIEPWIADYSSGSAIHLNTLRGSIPYNEPLRILDTLYAEIRYDGCEYTFARGFEPAKTDYTEVVFKDRKLNIIPHGGTFYGQSGGGTWLDIDFHNPRIPILTTYVKTEALLSDDLVRLLKFYKIALPFKQLSGLTKADLTISVNLESIAVSADGTFRVEKGMFDFADQEIGVSDAEVSLHNADVTIRQLHASLFKGAIQMHVSGKMNPAKDFGDLAFVVDTVDFSSDNAEFFLENKNGLTMDYRIRPKGDTIDLARSYWKLNDRLIKLDPIRAAFDFKTFSGSFPTTFFSIDNHTKAYVSGEFNLKKPQMNLMVDLLSLAFKGVTLDQTNLPIGISFDKKLQVDLKEDSRWHYKNQEVMLHPSSFSVDENAFSIMQSDVEIANSFRSKVSGSFLFDKGRGTFNLDELSIADNKGKKLLAVKERIPVYIVSKEDTVVKLPELGLLFTHYADAGWSFQIKDLSKLYVHSAFMQEYNLSKGAVTFVSSEGSEPYHFYGTMDYPYPLLVKDNTPFGQYDFNGRYENKTAHVVVNNEINITYGDKLAIESSGIGYNLASMLTFLDDHPGDGNKSIATEVEIRATDTFVYLSPERRALAETLTLQFADGRLTSQLYYRKGGAGFELDGDRFFFYGQKLDDTFMSRFFAFSEFRGGELSFYAGGKLHDFNGIVKVKNTRVKEYKILNNMLAFVNTIPALVTFSVPHYTTRGLSVKNAYAGFSSKDRVMTFQGFRVDSEELDITGDGVVDFNNNTIDMEASLKTEAGANIAKVPLLGYILVGKDDRAVTTLTIKGDLYDPKIENTLAKDIAVAPFNILKRAVTFPVHYLEKIEKR